MDPSTQGLGIFDCSMPQQQPSRMQELPPSPPLSTSWSHPPSTMAEASSTFAPSASAQRQPSVSSQQHSSSIFSTSIDPFSEYNNSASTCGMISAAGDEAPGLVFCQTPPSTNMPSSHRSSVSSSCSPSHQPSPDSFTPRMKADDHNEWFVSAGGEPILQRGLTTQDFSPYTTALCGPTATTEDLYKSPAGEWTKSVSSAYPLDLSGFIVDDRATFGSTSILSNMNRIKKKRQRTTPEEATHECRVCGKLFKRSYNWKSHMETHNPERKYPHPCTAMVGNQPCTKKFQRKTDLDRHYDSVHLKARNHRCTLCGNRFARRDTLRRHSEDGCPKRFELGFRDSTAPPSTTPSAAASSSSLGRWSSISTPTPSFTTPAITRMQPNQRSFSVSGALPVNGAQAASFFDPARAVDFTTSPIEAAGVSIFS